MPEPEKTEPKPGAKPEAPANGFFDKLLNAAGMGWFRTLTHNLGGRKLLVSGGALAIIDRIVQVGGDSFAMPHAVACLSVALTAGFMMFATAWEDSKKEKKA